MDEKGGNQEESKGNISTNYVNSRIVAMVAIAVVFCAVFITGLVVFGMRFIEIGKERPDRPSAQLPSESIEIKYEKTASGYLPADRGSDVAYKSSLLHSIGIDSDEYVIIKSTSEMQKFVSAVNELNEFDDDKFSYKVEEDFFESGAIVVIAKEEVSLSGICINSVHRDENYNIIIDASYSTENDTMEYGGEFVLLKIQNIQPKSVAVNWTEESVSDMPDQPGVKKPIVYLYPTKTMAVNVQLSNPERITVDYPDYNNGWTVTANPDGSLVTSSGKKLYALYYESQNIKKYDDGFEDGFVVAKNEVEEFLDEKLTILGLNYKEREEFITYWANVLEEKPYVFIRFQNREEIERNMGLSISPKPDTLIRIMMEYKPLNKKTKVNEQKLQKVDRKGFTAVEWGGTEIK